MKTFPTLYKKNANGSIQQWTIACDGPAITVIHGQVGGKLQTGVDIVRTGKNAGRSNATTPEQQAESEMTAKHEKQLKKGYVLTIEGAQAGEVDAVIEGGLLPMLAPSKVYPHFAHKLTFPVYVQPKMDGSRCIAIVKDGKCTLWTRTRKPIYCVPHIVAAMEQFAQGCDGIWDGELFADAYSENFEALMSIIRKDEPSPGHEGIEYHVYDMPSCKENFGLRSSSIWRLFDSLGNSNRLGPLVRVETHLADDDISIRKIHEMNLAAGHEGSMIRDDGPYEGGKRSYHLQKLKETEDREYTIVRAEEGRGKDAGTIGAFVCVTDEGKEFKARLKATYARRRELFENPEQWSDMLLTVTYQNLTQDLIPRFPIGKAIRNYD